MSRDVFLRGDGFDETGEIMRALHAGPGAVALPAGTFRCGELRMPSHVALRGEGPGATVLLGARIRLDDPRTAERVALEGLTIREAPGDAVVLDQPDLQDGRDVRHRLADVEVLESAARGVVLGANVRGASLERVSVRRCGGPGLTVEHGATDNAFRDCDSGQNRGHGIEIHASNLVFQGCSAWGNGLDTRSWTWLPDVNGWQVYGHAGTDGARLLTLLACRAQENAAHGFALFGSAWAGPLEDVELAHCEADSNNAYRTQTGQGEDRVGVLIAGDESRLAGLKLLGGRGRNSPGKAGQQAADLALTGRLGGLVIAHFSGRVDAAEAAPGTYRVV